MGIHIHVHDARRRDANQESVQELSKAAILKKIQEGVWEAENDVVPGKLIQIRIGKNRKMVRVARDSKTISAPVAKVGKQNSSEQARTAAAKLKEAAKAKDAGSTVQNLLKLYGQKLLSKDALIKELKKAGVDETTIAKLTKGMT